MQNVFLFRNIACLHVFFQGNFSSASIYAGSNCVELKGPEIIIELTELLKFLTLCMLFSKKPFPVFLETAGYSHDDVLLQKPKAGVCHVYLILPFLLLLVMISLFRVTMCFLSNYLSTIF